MSNIIKRSKNLIKKLESFYTSHPSFETVKELYLNNTIKSIASVKKTLNNIKVKKNGELYKTSVKKVEKLEEQLIETKATKKISQKEITINASSLFSGKHDWWIHYKQIKKMMIEEPSAFITHSVYFYNNNELVENDNGDNYIKFNFPNILSIEDIKRKIQHRLYPNGSDGDWIVREFIFGGDSQDLAESESHNYDSRKVIITTTAYHKISNTDTQIRLTQNFKNNDTGDCVYKGLLQFFVPYSLSEKYSKGKNIYNKLIKNEKKYSKAFTVEELDILAKDINCSFTIKDLINNNAQDIFINKNFSNYYNIEFINTKYNHLDVNLCFSEAEEVSKDKYEELKKKEPFYVEKFNYITTIDKKYKIIDNDFKVLFNTWKQDNKINDCKIPINSLAYNFINQYDDKIHRFFNNEFIIKNSLYNEIDMKKAYYNYYKCDEYIGLPSGSFICVSGVNFSTDTFNEQFKNGLVGFYEVEIIYNNKPNLDYFGFVSGSKYILFSSMIKLLSDIVEFKFINYCVSPSIDIKFNKEFKKTLINDKLYNSDDIPNELKNKPNIKAYCKAIGILGIDNYTTQINIKPLDKDNDFYKTLINDNIYKVDDIYKIIEDIENPSSLKHLAFGIKAYSQTMILKQMLSMNYKDIFGVKVDSIVYKKDAIFNITPTYINLFKAPSESKIKSMLYNDKNISKERKNNDARDYGLDFGDDDDDDDDDIDYNSSYFKKYFIKSYNDVIFDNSPLPNNQHITKKLIFSGGAGGTGKTHSLLSSNIFMRNKILFSSNCWELIQDKVNEFKVFGLSLPKLTGTMNNKTVEKINTGFIKYKIIDELTLNNKDIIDTIINDDNNRNFIFLLGDIDYDGFFYQCSITKNIFNPSEYKDLQYVEYTKSYRFDEKLQTTIKQVRTDMKESQNVYELYIKFKKIFSSNFQEKETVIINKNDIGISALQPIDDKGVCKFSESFFKNGSEKQYYIKNTKYKKGIYKGGKLEEEPENNKNYICSLFRTVHSYQGRQLTQDNKIIILINSLFDFNLLYTAISRARRLDQIIIIEELSKKDKLYLNYVSKTIQ